MSDIEGEATTQPSRYEIENVIRVLEVTRAKWNGNTSYARKLDVELYALRLALMFSMIVTADDELAAQHRKPWHGRSFRWRTPH